MSDTHITVKGIYSKTTTAKQIKQDLDDRLAALVPVPGLYEKDYWITTELTIAGTVMHYEASLDAYRSERD